MRTRFIFLAVCMMMTTIAFTQIVSSEAPTKVSFAQMKIPDSLLKNFKLQTDVPDSINKTLVAQTRSMDTINSSNHEESKLPETKAAVKKLDKRWFISPLLKLQAQDFGMIEKRQLGYISDAHTLSFQNRSNMSASASVYKNFSGNLSMSIDGGFAQGRVRGKDSLVSGAAKKNYGLVNATMYFHLLAGQYRLQPYLAAGFNSLFGNGAFMSAPVGVGVKFTTKHIMIESQTAYARAISKNIANSMMYTLGIYIPLKRKKDEEEDKSKDKDTAKIRITNIINNYYLLNLDSLKKVQEDSLNRVKEIKKRNDMLALENDRDPLDPDDPMNLPAAVKNIVYFNYDQYSLTSSAFGSVDQVIQKLKDNKILRVHLKGYTDLAGSEQYNSALSKKRAQMVYDYMNSRGVPAERMIISSYGKNNPVIKGNDPGTAWMNRRCEIVIYEKN
ncbi:MAG: OmpA family protein [Flavitalea sp.]